MRTVYGSNQMDSILALLFSLIHAIEVIPQSIKHTHIIPSSEIFKHSVYSHGNFRANPLGTAPTALLLFIPEMGLFNGFTWEVIVLLLAAVVDDLVWFIQLGALIEVDTGEATSSTFCSTSSSRFRLAQLGGEEVMLLEDGVSGDFFFKAKEGFV